MEVGPLSAVHCPSIYPGDVTRYTTTNFHYHLYMNLLSLNLLYVFLILLALSPQAPIGRNARRSLSTAGCLIFHLNRSASFKEFSLFLLLWDLVTISCAFTLPIALWFCKLQSYCRHQILTNMIDLLLFPLLHGPLLPRVLWGIWPIGISLSGCFKKASRQAWCRSSGNALVWPSLVMWVQGQGRNTQHSEWGQSMVM